MKTKEISVNLPFGIGGVTFAANEAEQHAAWELYFEFSTRILNRTLDRPNARLRAVLDSLHSLIGITRETLRRSGPSVAHGHDSLGPLAIRIVNEGLAPYLSRWHYRLESHEEMCPEGTSLFDHERTWEHLNTAIDELEELQGDLESYIVALGEISGIENVP